MNETLTYILGALLGAVLLGGGYLIIYLTVRFKIAALIPNAVDIAEDLKSKGREKLLAAVDCLYDKIPAIVKPFIKKSLIESWVEKAFKSIDDYGKKQIIKTECEPNERN